MIFITEVWLGLCKLITYLLLKALMSFGPTQGDLHVRAICSVQVYMHTLNFVIVQFISGH